jgi:hypothetical protein
VPGDPYLDFEKALASIRVRTVEDAVDAIRQIVAAGAEHVKLRPTSSYKFEQNGVPQYLGDASARGVESVDRRSAPLRQKNRLSQLWR